MADSNSASPHGSDQTTEHSSSCGQPSERLTPMSPEFMMSSEPISKPDGSTDERKNTLSCSILAESTDVEPPSQTGADQALLEQQGTLHGVDKSKGGSWDLELNEESQANMCENKDVSSDVEAPSASLEGNEDCRLDSTSLWTTRIEKTVSSSLHEIKISLLRDVKSALTAIANESRYVRTVFASEDLGRTPGNQNVTRTAPANNIERTTAHTQINGNSEVAEPHATDIRKTRLTDAEIASNGTLARGAHPNQANQHRLNLIDNVVHDAIPIDAKPIEETIAAQTAAKIDDLQGQMTTMQAQPDTITVALNSTNRRDGSDTHLKSRAPQVKPVDDGASVVANPSTSQPSFLSQIDPTVPDFKVKATFALSDRKISTLQTFTVQASKAKHVFDLFWCDKEPWTEDLIAQDITKGRFDLISMEVPSGVEPVIFQRIIDNNWAYDGWHKRVGIGYLGHDIVVIPDFIGSDPSRADSPSGKRRQQADVTDIEFSMRVWQHAKQTQFYM